MTGPPLSVGVDAVSVPRVADALPAVADRAFTDDEAAYCRSRADPPQHFAARWAAKEAAIKALPDDPSVGFGDVEVVGAGGDPSLSLSGPARAARESFAPGATTCVSLTHDRGAGVAAAVVALATDTPTARSCLDAASLDEPLRDAGGER